MIWRNRRERKPVTVETKDPWGFEFYEAMYKAESDLREKMLGRLATPTALTVAIFGALGLMLREYARVANALPNGPYWNYYGHAFWVLFCLTCISLIASLYYLGRFWYGNEYKLMPTAAQLRAYHEQLKTHYAPYENPDKNVADAFRAYLLERYVDCGTCAADVNHLRTARLFRANGALIVSALLALITYGIFTIPSLMYPNGSGPAVAASSCGEHCCRPEHVSQPLATKE